VLTNNISSRDRPAGGAADPPLDQTPTASPSNEECRRALRAVLDSNVVATSRRLRDFIGYAGQAALEGREELDQYEIACKVLQRQADFNPIEDASVRKLASQARHKLEEYYSDESVTDPVVALLPSRSYVLRFRYRKDLPDLMQAGTAQQTSGTSPEPGAGPDSVPLTVPAVRAPRRFQPYLVGALLGAAPLLALLLFQLAGKPDSAASARWTSEPAGIAITTKRGDLRGPVNEIAAGAVLLGPAVGPMEEVTASMRFEPSGPTQQAGIMLFRDRDHFVRLGYQFKLRTMIEMGMEWAGRYLETLATFEFDPVALRSSFCWFTLRRDGGRVQGFVSRDGFDWRPLGGSLEDKGPSASPRAALYAFDGRTENPSVRALFRNFGVGLSFHNRPEGLEELPKWAPGWTVHSGCSGTVEARIVRNAMEVAYRQESLGCSWELVKAAPEGDWSFSTVLDFMPVSGGSAGLAVTCERGRLSISRRALSGGSILLEQPGDDDISLSDFPGWPMITLRLASARGRITASFSRDGERFIRIPREISLERIGKPVNIGIVTMVPRWSSQQDLPPARFYRIQQDIESSDPLP
jgi:hypothetical protein